MHRYAIVIVVLWVCLCAGLAAAQTGIVEPVPYVYRMKIDDCKFEPVARRQTGFRVEGVVGIVTALHGVADCETMSAVADDGLTIFTNLVITAVDIDRDIALLTSPDLEQLPTDGLVPSSLSTAEILTAALRIVGYPLGLDEQDVDVIESVRDLESLDNVIPDTEESIDFVKRKSPDIDIDVLNLQAQLLPGHSGAPVIDQTDQIVAVGDGGLRSGTVGRSWAIPWSSVRLASIDADDIRERLAELATKNITALSFSSTYPGQLGEVAALATYMVRVIDGNNVPIANAEVLLTHSAGYEIGVTDSEGFYTFHLSTDVSYIQSQIQVEAPGYPLYSRTLSNVTNKVGTEIVRLKSILTATPSVSSTKPTLCGFEFLVLDEETEYPIDHAYVTVILAGARKSGYTLKDGSFAASLPCNEEYPKAEVRVSASTYQLNSQRITLVGQIETVYLAHLATPIATLTITPTPTVILPLPSLTATPMPSETPRCQIVGVFSSIWHKNIEKLGCNTSPVITSPITQEPFETGYMIWSKLSDLIYVLPRSAYWSQHSDGWDPTENALPCDQAQQFGYPAMGFGKLWCATEKVRTMLGNPLGEELPNELAQQQTFEGGFMFEIFGGKTIILFEDGTWSEN